ncbi:MAG: HEPN domain-containing protein [Chloroflexi bacterium]|nr:HEPN domain-containing protein [Chloroflexota bacterium]
MSDADPAVPGSWYAQGDVDFRAAEILLAAGESLPVSAFLIQQTAEKYLKGYLLAHGWNLRRTHDLEILVQDAIARDQEFDRFLIACQRITEYYIESRYPLGVLTSFESAQLAADFAIVNDLADLIRRKTPPAAP